GRSLGGCALFLCGRLLLCWGFFLSRSGSRSVSTTFHDGEGADHTALFVTRDGAVVLEGFADGGIFGDRELGGFAVVQQRRQPAAPVVDRQVMLQEAVVLERQRLARGNLELGGVEGKRVHRLDCDSFATTGAFLSPTRRCHVP